MSPLSVQSSTDTAQVEASCRQLGITVEEFRELHRQSINAADNAYCPYSNFPVGAAVLTRYGIQGPASSGGTAGSNGHSRFILGANVENASYPVGTCAERVALARAVFDGHREFKAIAVIAPRASSDTPCSPCGMCRQLSVRPSPFPPLSPFSRHSTNCLAYVNSAVSTCRFSCSPGTDNTLVSS